MSLSEKSRSALYVGLTGLVEDEEAVGEMLSYFPARDVEEPVTKEFLRAELAAQDARMLEGFARLEHRIDAGLAIERQMTVEGFVGLRSDMDAEFGVVRSEFAAVRSEFVAVRSEMEAGFAAVRRESRAEFQWLVSILLASVAAVFAGLALIG